MNVCPTCGRRHRPRRAKQLAPLPLFEWQPTRSAAAMVKATPAYRVVLLHGCLNPEGEPRGGIVQPNGRTVAFHDLAAATAALRQMEARR